MKNSKINQRLKSHDLYKLPCNGKLNVPSVAIEILNNRQKILTFIGFSHLYFGHIRNQEINVLLEVGARFHRQEGCQHLQSIKIFYQLWSSRNILGKGGVREWILNFKQVQKKNEFLHGRFLSRDQQCQSSGFGDL